MKGVLFTDAQALCYAIYSSDWSEYGTTVADCKEILRNRNDIKVQWVSRSSKEAAHMLAKTSIAYDHSMIWNYIPNCISDFI